MQDNSFLPGHGLISFELYRSRLVATLLCSMMIALAAPLAAQTQRTGSTLAGVELPTAAREWSVDADGSKAATLDLAASLAGSECGAREALAWSAVDQALADELRTRTEAAFEAAGWSLQPVSRTSEGQRILLARRAGERLVMVWRPEEKETGLLLCEIEPASPATQDMPPDEAAAMPPPAAPAEPNPEVGAPEAPPATGAELDRAPQTQEASPAPVPEAPMTPPAVVDQPAAQAATGSSAANFWLRLLAVGLLILGGIGLIVRDFRSRAMSVEWQWPTASATIERGWVEEEEREDAAGVLVKTYMPMLRYRYRVDGEEFQGGDIGLDDRPLPSAEAAVRLLSKYPDFATVEVRYDPDDPSFAVIEAARPPPGREFYFGLGAIILAVAVLLAHLR